MNLIGKWTKHWFIGERVEARVIRIMVMSIVQILPVSTSLNDKIIDVIRLSEGAKEGTKSKSKKFELCLSI